MTISTLRRIAEIRRSLDALEAELVGHGQEEEAPRETVMVEPHIAARRLGLTPDAVRKACRVHGIGEKRGGRWFVDLDALKAVRS